MKIRFLIKKFLAVMVVTLSIGLGYSVAAKPDFSEIEEIARSKQVLTIAGVKYKYRYGTKLLHENGEVMKNQKVDDLSVGTKVLFEYREGEEMPILKSITPFFD